MIVNLGTNSGDIWPTVAAFFSAFAAAAAALTTFLDHRWRKNNTQADIINAKTRAGIFTYQAANVVRILHQSMIENLDLDTKVPKELAVTMNSNFDTVTGILNNIDISVIDTKLSERVIHAIMAIATTKTTVMTAIEVTKISELVLVVKSLLDVLAKTCEAANPNNPVRSAKHLTAPPSRPKTQATEASKAISTTEQLA